VGNLEFFIAFIKCPQNATSRVFAKHSKRIDKRNAWYLPAMLIRAGNNSPSRLASWLKILQYRIDVFRERHGEYFWFDALNGYAA
jgi:hypothetical protein